MVTHLYKNFLADEKVYLQNIDFWKSIVYTLLSSVKLTFSDYLTIHKPNGQIYQDGNPIFHFKLDNSERAVRIIQEAPETFNFIEFSAWINSKELTDGSKIQELVISLELSHETTLMAVDLINVWVVNNLSLNKMERLINKLDAIKNKLFSNDIEPDNKLKYA